MKNTLKLLLFILSLRPALLSAQTLQEADAMHTLTDSTLAFSIKIPFKKAIPSPPRWNNDVLDRFYYGIDSTENARYIFGFSVVRPGAFVMDDSSFYPGINTKLRTLFSQVSRDTFYFMKGCMIEDFLWDLKSRRSVNGVPAYR